MDVRLVGPDFVHAVMVCPEFLLPEADDAAGARKLIKEHLPDAIIIDRHFFWNVDVAVTEVPEYLRRRASKTLDDGTTWGRISSARKRSLGLAVNTSFDLEHKYCETYVGTWAPPEGWKERIGERDMVVTGWAPQAAVLNHPSVGVFVTHCGWNSVLDTVSAGVPVLTWPMVCEQFITERFITEVLGRDREASLAPEGAGVLRSTRYQEHGLIPAVAVAQGVAEFMEPGGEGDAARCRIKELSAKAHAAMADGGSSHYDLRRLIHDLMEAKT
ncbi:hypothetical protein PR202_gb01715 [Eleusine coracana subsp. coracana]|uniref:UDP-glycosyltransferases domain-containing protein n=1 Tax=Eleusine coracana subsp. coracana TaxID=191504 RepID=A0AAV5DUV9_ELECO|nr:hypothetical protein PR202_gb01715 [Eleusine coracana subsp. coracana]